MMTSAFDQIPPDWKLLFDPIARRVLATPEYDSMSSLQIASIISRGGVDGVVMRNALAAYIDHLRDNPPTVPLRGE